MELDDLESNGNDFVDKKLMSTVEKSLSMFASSGTHRGIKAPKISKGDQKKSLDLNNVSDMLSKMLGKDMEEKDQMEFKLGLMELLDSLESKYIENPTTRGILNKVIFMLLMRFKAK